jgi:hypothetical protein
MPTVILCQEKNEVFSSFSNIFSHHSGLKILGKKTESIPLLERIK